MARWQTRAASIATVAVVLLAACGERPESPPEVAVSDAEPSPASAQPTSPAPTTVPSPSASASSPVPTRVRAVGTEPFWAARIDGTQITYMTPEYPEGFAVTAERRLTAAGVALSGTIDGKPFTIAITPGTCSDGMSDEVYPFSVTRTIGPDTQRGCARPL